MSFGTDHAITCSGIELYAASTISERTVKSIVVRVCIVNQRNTVVDCGCKANTDGCPLPKIAFVINCNGIATHVAGAVLADAGCQLEIFGKSCCACLGR